MATRDNAAPAGATTLHGLLHKLRDRGALQKAAAALRAINDSEDPEELKGFCRCMLAMMSDVTVRSPQADSTGVRGAMAADLGDGEEPRRGFLVLTWPNGDRNELPQEFYELVSFVKENDELIRSICVPSIAHAALEDLDELCQICKSLKSMLTYKGKFCLGWVHTAITMNGHPHMRMEKMIIDNWGNASSSVLKEFNANRVSLGHTTFKKADLNKVLAGKPDPVVLRGKPKSVGHPSIAVLEDDDDDVTAPASPLDQDGSGMSEDDTGMVEEEDEGSRTHERGRPMESVIEDFTEYFSLNDVTDLGESDSESDNESTENRLSPAVPPAPETMNESDEDSTDHDGLFRSRLLGRSSIRLTNAWLSPDTM